MGNASTKVSVPIISICLIAACTLFFIHMRQRGEYLKQLTANRLAAKALIESRYIPSPQLSDRLKNPRYAGLWIVTDDAKHCGPNSTECFNVKFQAALNDKTTIEAEWLVNVGAMSETPLNDAARDMFVRKEQRP